MLDWPAIRERLRRVFEPEGDGRLYGDLAAKAVFTMLYVGAIDGRNQVRPTMVLWMSDAAAGMASDPQARAEWYEAALRGSAELDRLHERWKRTAERWYADNTREPLRDEVFRGWAERGALLRDHSRPTTSPAPIWSLASDFAALFHPDLVGTDLDESLRVWQRDHLNPVGLARLAYERASSAATDHVTVTMPDGTPRHLAPGTSSAILKGVIEQALPLVARQPAVLLLSESANKVDIVDAHLLEGLGLRIEVSTLLPDALLFDAHAGTFWFVEVVATDGPITTARRQAMLEWATRQPRPVPPDRCAFLTAFMSRDALAFRRLVASLAWDSWVWFLLEPDKLVHFRDLGDGAPDPDIG